MKREGDGGRWREREGKGGQDKHKVQGGGAPHSVTSSPNTRRPSAAQRGMGRAVGLREVAQASLTPPPSPPNIMWVLKVERRNKECERGSRGK